MMHGTDLVSEDLVYFRFGPASLALERFPRLGCQRQAVPQDPFEIGMHVGEALRVMEAGIRIHATEAIVFRSIAYYSAQEPVADFDIEE